MNHIRKVENFIENLICEFKLPEELRGRITLSIVEAVNNAILYGNKQNPQKMVKIHAVRSNKKITVTIEDEGEGFDFNHFPDPTTRENSEKATGRGLYLMKSLTDELLFAKNGAKVMMTISLPN